MKITLSVKNNGAVPAFKNKKRAIQKANGQLRTLTDPKTRSWMDKVTLSFVCQLSSITPTTTGETLTAQQLRSLIVSLMPLDDSRQWVSQLVISDTDVEPGQEGATITIQKI